MPDGLHLELLGSMQISHNGVPVTGFISTKAQVLLCYLAVTGQPHSREALANLLWGEMREENARGNLRVVLSNLRHLIPNYMVITRQSVAFNSAEPYALDVEGFQSRLHGLDEGTIEQEIEALREAMELYRGDFLKDVHIRDAPVFEEWLLARRERLRQLALQALYQLSIHHTTRGSYPAGIEYTTRLLALEPWQEEAHRQLMLLLALNGQRSAALVQYDICCRTLAEELGVEPSEETSALYEQIRSMSLSDQARGEDRSLRLVAHRQNLPLQMTPFIGRERELIQIADRLANAGCRLLSLVGPGGMGKTRLALQAAANHLAAFPDGIYFVPLATVPAPEAMPAAISASLSCLFDSGAVREQLLAHLHEKRLMLVLDNFEHLRGETGLLIELLERAPGIKLLVTTRERLNIRAEHLLEVGGLPVPGPAERAQAQSYAAIQLFIQSAGRVDPAFKVSADNLGAIVRICELLDGMPLGIELAAAWTRDFTCPEIVQEIERSLDFLNTSLNDLPERHRSLRAVFDHSWSLLPAAERAVFQELSVFRGGFSRGAASAVTGAPAGVLAALSDKSLLRRVASGRYEMHERLRQYAEEQLRATPEAHRRACARHCAYYSAFLRERAPYLKGWRQRDALEEIGVEIENVRAAWAYAVESRNLDALAEGVESLFHFYDMHSWFQEGAETFGAAVAMLRQSTKGGAGSPVLQGKLLARQAWFTFHLGHPDRARQMLVSSSNLLRTASPPDQLPFTLNYLGAIALHMGRYEEVEWLLDESLRLCQEQDNQYDQAIALNILGSCAFQQGRIERARECCQQSLDLKRANGDRWGMAFSLTSLSAIATSSGDYQQAQQLVQESLAIRNELQDRRGIAICLNQLGDLARAMQNDEQAEQLYGESAALFKSIGNLWGATSALNNLGQVAAQRNDFAGARRYFFDALRASQEIGAIPRTIDVLIGIARLLAQTGQELQALELLALVLQHTHGDHAQEAQARALQSHLRAELPASQWSRAEARMQERTLGAVASELLGTIEVPSS